MEEKEKKRNIKRFKNGNFKKKKKKVIGHNLGLQGQKELEFI